MKISNKDLDWVFDRARHLFVDLTKESHEDERHFRTRCYMLALVELLLKKGASIDEITFVDQRGLIMPTDD